MGIPATCTTCGFSETRNGQRGSRLAEMHCHVCGKRSLARSGSKSALAFEANNPIIGKRVRFTVEGLGASELDDLGHVVGDVVVGPPMEGTVAFLHPNPKLRVEHTSRTGEPHWFYVAVWVQDDNPDPPWTMKGGKYGRTLYVGATLRMCEIVEVKS